MYYPLSQITPNLYTNGNEFQIVSTKANYTGYYWKTSKGQFFTGKTPQDLPTEQLIPIPDLSANLALQNQTQVVIDQENVKTANYINLSNADVNKVVLLPTYFLTIPTFKDYQIGEMRRYFCKKTNEILYLEISQDTYNKLLDKNPSILYQYYQPFNIPWQLTGDKEQVRTTNRNIVALTMKNQKLPQFDKYLKEDYVKYYKA